MLSLNEHLTDAAIKLSKTLLESPIQLNYLILKFFSSLSLQQ